MSFFGIQLLFAVLFLRKPVLLRVCGLSVGNFEGSREPVRGYTCW